MKQNYFLRMFTILLFLCITTHSYAKVYSGSCGKNVKWSLDTETGLLKITGSGEMIDYRYDNPWYSYNSYIKECTIEDGVTTIGNYAFAYCDGLTSITIPNSVTTIGNYAFYKCTGLTSVTIPNSVTTIGEYTFSGCKGLTSITIPNSVTTIGRCAFEDCTGLTSVNIPNSVTTIEECAFEYCTELTSVTIPNSVTTIGNHAFAYCDELTSVTIPNSVTTIGSEAFYGTPWHNNLPDGEIYIGSCFYKYKGTMPQNSNINIKEGTTTIGNDAFFKCTGLTSVTIPNSVTTIGESAFLGCSGLTSVNIPNSVTTIEGYAFYKCTGLTSITIPNSVTTIGEYTFYECTGLTSVHITDIAAWCNITFDGANSNPLSYAKHLYLNGKEIKDLVIPDDVTTIRDYAFGYCTGLTSVTIPNSVTTIGDYAFYNCKNLKTVFNLSDLNITKGSTYYGYVSNYADKVVNADTQIGDFFFTESSEGNTLCCYIGNESNLTLPEDYKGGNYSIGESAFDGCANLTSLTIGSKITNIRSNAFAGCTALNSIIWNAKDYPDLASAEEMPFKDSQITSITFGEDVTSVPKFLCNGMTSLKEVIFPQSLTSIRHNAFENCTGLTSITLPQNVRKIGPSAFAGCSNIKSIYCLAQEPPICSSDALNGIDTWDCTLYVPEGRTSAYMSDPLWREFFDIFEITGIDAPKADKNTSAFDIYNLKGQLVRKAATTTQGLKSGLYIINSKKIWVR